MFLKHGFPGFALGLPSWRMAIPIFTALRPALLQVPPDLGCCTQILYALWGCSTLRTWGLLQLGVFERGPGVAGICPGIFVGIEFGPAPVARPPPLPPTAKKAVLKRHEIAN